MQSRRWALALGEMGTAQPICSVQHGGGLALTLPLPGGVPPGVPGRGRSLLHLRQGTELPPGEEPSAAHNFALRANIWAPTVFQSLPGLGFGACGDLPGPQVWHKGPISYPTPDNEIAPISTQTGAPRPVASQAPQPAHPSSQPATGFSWSVPPSPSDRASHRASPTLTRAGTP